jgi:hypothetical protein
MITLYLTIDEQTLFSPSWVETGKEFVMTRSEAPIIFEVSWVPSVILPWNFRSFSELEKI